MSRALADLNFRERVRMLATDFASKEVVNWAKVGRLAAHYGLDVVTDGVHETFGDHAELAIELAATIEDGGIPERALLLLPGSRHARSGRVFVLDHEFEVAQ